MTRASDWLENAWLNTAFGGGSHAATFPTTYYLGLATVDTGQLEANSLTNELAVANGYARQAITFRDGDGTALPTATGTIENAATITFTASGGAWSEATYVFVIDAASGAGTAGVLLWAPVAAFTLGDTDSVAFDPGDIVFTVN